MESLFDVGIGYVGAEDSDDIETGMERLMEVSRWLRKHLPYLQEQHQKDFPNQSQYAAVNQMEKDYSLLISGETMDEITGRVWIESHLLGRDEPIEERIAQLENTPVTIEYRRI